ncbi:MAG TPA: hypothetical protein VGS07_33570 [Thermoanaerobaculia bacterium]|nr:hypothetical protein [Thermoanaerobaculia bacterium]
MAGGGQPPTGSGKSFAASGEPFTASGQSTFDSGQPSAGSGESAAGSGERPRSLRISSRDRRGNCLRNFFAKLHLGGLTFSVSLDV